VKMKGAVTAASPMMKEEKSKSVLNQGEGRSGEGGRRSEDQAGAPGAA